MQKTSSRLLTLLSLLQTHRDWSGEELADRLAITPRTVRRDMDRLRELGYLIATVKGPGGGYRLEAGARMPPMLFDDDQAIALSVALQSAAAGTLLAEDAARALATVRQVMSGPLMVARRRRAVDARQTPREEAPRLPLRVGRPRAESSPSSRAGSGGPALHPRAAVRGPGTRTGQDEGCPKARGREDRAPHIR